MADVKDIYLAELAEIKERLVKSRKAQVASWVVVGVAFLVFAGVLFFRSPRKDYTAIDDRVELRDSVIAAKDETIKAIEAQRLEIMEGFKELQRENKELQRAFSANQARHQQNNKEYEKVPPAVRDLTKDELRRQFSGH